MNFPPVWMLGSIFGISEIVLTRARRPAAGDREKDRSSFLVLNLVAWTCVALSIAAQSALGFAHIHHAGRFYPAGVAIFAAGVCLRWWSILVLGRFFTVKVSISPDHHIVERGPYRFLRHPSYTGALLAILGLGICMANWISLAVILVPPVFAMCYRIAVEERALTEFFGDEYRRYSGRTYRLIPFVY
jgi:protein-S-isoprenylcysteine O-methyltransferase